MKYATEEAFVGANAFGKGAANTAYAQYFVGNSYLNPLTDPQVTALHLSNVTFEPGVATTGTFTTPQKAAVSC